MAYLRAAVTSVAAMAAFIGISPPPTALADAPLSGSFTVSTEPPSVWTILSSDCLPNCVARVSSTQQWHGYASLRDHTWTLSVYRGSWSRSAYPADPANCPYAGSDILISQTFQFDATSLNGAVTTVRGDQCSGGHTVSDSAPISLSRID